MEKKQFQRLLDRVSPEKIKETGTIYKELLNELDTMKDITEGQKAVLVAALLIEYGRMEREKKE